MTTATLTVTVKLEGYTLSQAHRMMEDAFNHLYNTGRLGLKNGLSVPFEDHKQVSISHKIAASEK